MGLDSMRNLTFGDAVERLKRGRRVSRAGWHEKDTWLAFMPGVVIPDGMVNGRTKKFVPRGDLNVGGYIVLMTAQGVWQPGWVASQADMLAEDWFEVEDSE